MFVTDKTVLQSGTSDLTTHDLTIKHLRDKAFSIDDNQDNSKLYQAFTETNDEIENYLIRVEDFSDVSDIADYKRLLSDISYGFRKAKNAIKFWSILLTDAERERKRIEAQAAHDRFPVYVAERKAEGREVKTDAAMRKWYVDIDHEVILIRAKVDLLKIFVNDLIDSKIGFLKADGRIRAVIYGPNTSINHTVLAGD